MKILLLILGAVTFSTGPVAFLAPHTFYESIPGLSAMGPFNMHFVRDVGLAFTASGVCVIFGTITKNWKLAIAGALWPFLHALFHIQIWFKRGMPFDYIAGFDFAAVIVPALTMMVLSFYLDRREYRAE